MSKRNISGVNYATSVVPADYKCDDCGATGVKLFREVQTFADQTVLQCADCAEISQQKLHGPGWESPFKRGEGDQIGWRVPAVPVDGENTYWGYTSVPQAGCEWWDNLPTRPGEQMQLNERKSILLMHVVERIVYGLYKKKVIPVTEPTFELLELAQRIIRAKNEKEIQSARTDLSTFNK